MSAEDKIRRAEEIYNRRKEAQIRTNTAKVNINNKKDIKLFKKMFIQILVCLAIYSIFYLVKNNNYIFSEDFVNKAKEVLAYDVNFSELYYKSTEWLRNHNIIPNNEKQMQENSDQAENLENTEETTPNTNQEGIGGAELQDTIGLSQMEQDAISIKNSISFINPIEGSITSIFGWRNPTTNSVPKYHTGIDIANTSGTIIHSATDGEVVLASSEGDYRKSFKSAN